MDEKIASLENMPGSMRLFIFETCWRNQKSRMEIIVTFLAVLELMKMGKISITQEHLFDDILIRSRISG